MTKKQRTKAIAKTVGQPAPQAAVTQPIVVQLAPAPVGPVIEVCRSFSYKLNCEDVNPAMKYQSRDFFASWKAQAATMEEAAALSERLYAQAMNDVLKSAHDYTKLLRERMRAQSAQSAAMSNAAAFRAKQEAGLLKPNAPANGAPATDNNPPWEDKPGRTLDAAVIDENPNTDEGAK